MDVLHEKLNPALSPLSARCSCCGAEATFDPLRQNYHCLFCGGSTEVDQPLRSAALWQERQQKRVREWLWDEAAAFYRCPGCGSAVITARPAEADCPFCGSALARGALPREADVPALALPFTLTAEQAREQLKAWAGKNPLQKEARRVLKHLDKLQAYYLPCRLIRGPVEFLVTRSASQRSYRCRSYARDVLVNASAQQDSLLLEAAGPFDWSRAQALDPAQLDGVWLKLADLPEQKLERRSDEELAIHQLAAVERSMRSSHLQLLPDSSLALRLPVLAPVYLLTAEDTRVLINGQTGRVAVSRDKPRRSHIWLMEPIILSLLAAIAWMYLSAGNLELFFLGTLASIILIFSLLGGARGERLHRRLFRIRDPVTERWEGRFLLSDPEPTTGEAPSDTPLFFEALDGRSVPVEIRFYTARRIALMLLFALLTLALPYLLVCLITLFSPQMHPGDIEAAYGAVWYVIAAAALVLAWLSLGRSLLFDRPLLRRILPDGSTRPIPADKVRRGKLPLLKRLRAILSLDAIVGIGIGVLVVLLGSIVAMLPRL